jgi:hypothetical protein
MHKFFESSTTTAAGPKFDSTQPRLSGAAPFAHIHISLISLKLHLCKRQTFSCKDSRLVPRFIMLGLRDVLTLVTAELIRLSTREYSVLGNCRTDQVGCVFAEGKVPLFVYDRSKSEATGLDSGHRWCLSRLLSTHCLKDQSCL